MAHEEQDYIDGWQTYSNWIDDLMNDSTIIQKCDDTKPYPSIREQFVHVWANKEIRSELHSIFIKQLSLNNLINRPMKSHEESKRMRNLGNTSFKNGQHSQALNYYTQAVRFAPYPSHGDTASDSLALALANRSAALYSLTRYRLCLLDIDLAIKYGYPEANMFKLLIRKVKCLHILSIWANDVEQIKDDLRNLMKLKETKEFMKTEISNMFEFIEQTQPEEMEKDELDVVDETVMKISNVSKTISQAADCVEMSYDNEKGRYLLTNKDVSFGRLLITEEPFVCNLAPSKRSQYCYNCFGRLHSCGLSCRTCTQVLYCSVKCLEDKEPTHAYECNSLIDFQEKLGVAYLVSHIIFKVKFEFDKIPIFTKKSVEKRTLNEVLNIASHDWPDLVYKNEYASVLSLMDHYDDYDHNQIMGFTLTAVYLVQVFMHYFANDLHPSLGETETQLVLGSVILRHLLQLQTNLISILDQNIHGLVSRGHSLSDLEETPIGVGIYPTVSLLNHSCQPNILSIFHRNRFLARAASSFECGTEIIYCYGPSFNRMSKKDRQKRLKEQYFFTCNCDCCANSKENEARALVCPKCGGPVAYNQDLTHHCVHCNAENHLNVDKLLKQVEKYTLEIEKNSKNSATLKDLEGELQKILFWRNPIFSQLKAALIDCAEESQDLMLALKYCQEELDLSIRTYGENSIEAILTKMKLINLQWQHLYFTIEESETQEAKQAALNDLRTLKTTVISTRSKLKDLLNSTSILGAECSFDNELKFLSATQTNINKYLASHQETDEEAAQAAPAFVAPTPSGVSSSSHNDH